MIVLNTLLPLVDPPCPSRLLPKFSAQKEYESVPWNCTSLPFRVWYPKWKTASVCAMPIRPAMSTGETMYVCWIARVSATVALPKQSSLSSGVAPRRPPLRKPQPVWTMTAMRAVAPAADEEVDTHSPPLQEVWKPCWRSWLCTAVRLHKTRSWLVVPWRIFLCRFLRYSNRTTMSSTALRRSLGASQKTARKPPRSTVWSFATKWPICSGPCPWATSSGYRTATIAL